MVESFEFGDRGVRVAGKSRLERRELENHPRLGADALAPLARIAPLVPLVAIQHPERYDGGGYRPIAGDEVPLEARIIAVADVYDGLACGRCDSCQLRLRGFDEAGERDPLGYVSS